MFIVHLLLTWISRFSLHIKWSGVGADMKLGMVMSLLIIQIQFNYNF